jgi:thiamine pyrophosphokinase
MSESENEIVIENPDILSINDLLIDLSSLEKSIYPLSSFENLLNDNKALLMLNQKINLPKSAFDKLWNSSKIKVCADGGLNRLRNYDDSYIPDFVIGDLDSVTNSNLDYYKLKGTKIILQSSQYYTDFHKSISLINSYFNIPNLILNIANDIDYLEIEEIKHINENKIQNNIDVIILGGVGGRFDQTMATINQLYTFSISRPHLNLTIINPEHPEFIFLLKSGLNLINYPRLSNLKEIEIFGEEIEKSRPGLRNVGILPLLENAIISTNGLKWDVTNWSTNIKSKMSSSNLQVGHEGFIISTTNPLFITLEF